MVYELEGLKEHEVSRMNPEHSTVEFEALKENIACNGQLEPIRIYRNMIVDGRHRCRALRELNETTVKAIILPHNTKLEELKMIANSTEVRRHQTKTQLAIKAFFLCKDNKGLTQARAAKQVGVGLGLVKEAAGIYKRNPEFIKLLAQDKVCPIGGTFTTSLRVVLGYLKNEAAKLRDEAYYAGESESISNSEGLANSVDPVVEMLLVSISNLTDAQRVVIKEAI